MFFDRNDYDSAAFNSFNSTSYIVDKKFRKTERRSRLQIGWGIGLIVFTGLGILGGMVDTDTSEEVVSKAEYILSISSFIGLGVLLLFLGWRNKKLVESARRFNSIFLADNDGTVTCEELTRQLGIPAETIFNQLEKLFRIGMIQHCNIQRGATPCVTLINNPTNSTAFAASPVNLGFVHIRCVHCGGTTKIRAGSSGKCDYCGSAISN